ncbi:MAG: sugar ABC transporter permease [Lachnospiraceae bacterium]|jgi:raffinose/stachyose/melibiose transport system permease protein|nr:sugar ABC transporter permease [Lachnospiraceae bacterium]
MKKESSMSLRRRKETAVAAAVFLVPALLVIAVFVIYPILQSFITSGYEWNGYSSNKSFIGLANWAELLKDKVFWNAFKNNLLVMVLSIVIQMPIGLALATFLDKVGRKGNVCKVIWFIPMLMSSVAIGYLFRYALDANTGFVTAISKFFGGGTVDLLGNTGTVLITCIFIIAWQFIPFYMVYYLAGYSGLPSDVHEAAMVDGATESQYFWQISLPLLKPTIKSAVVLSIVGSLKYFDLVYVLTNGGPSHASELMATYMYSNAFSSYRMGYASAIASGMFLLISVIAIVTMRVLNGKED